MTLRRASILLLASIACGSSGPDDTGPLKSAVLPESAYLALPAIELVDAGMLCRVGTIACSATLFQLAVTRAPDQVLFTGISRKRLQLMFTTTATPVAVPLGGTGDGPGEYQFVHALGFSASGEPLAFAPVQQRVLRYGADGSVRSTRLVPVPPGLILSAFIRGELRAIATEPTRSGDPATVSVFAMDSGAKKVRRLYSLPIKQPAYVMSDLRPVPMPFAPVPNWAWREDGSIVHSDGSKLLVDVYDEAGGHQLRFGFETEPRKVTEADMAAERESRVRNVHDPRMIAALEESARRGAAHHPAITRIAALGNGQVWVRESPTEDKTMWIVFDASGKPLGRVELGTDDAVLASRGDTILITRDADPQGADVLRWVTMR